MVAGGSVYEVTLERGTDGSYLAWVHALPGCAVRAVSREDVLERLPQAISAFSTWIGLPEPAAPHVVVADEVESAIEADEDTEVIVASDRRPLTDDDWQQIRQWLARSRTELLELLGRLTDDELAARREGSERTVRAEIEHVAFVELMYAAWTFDLRSRDGLAEFLRWTRTVAGERMGTLACEHAADCTWADWGGAPRPEPWTPSKAARRLVWHELLHLRAIEEFAGQS